MVENVPHKGRAPNHQLGTTRLGLTLATLDFPLRKDELLDRLGNREVEVEKGERVPVARFFERTNTPEIKSISHAVNIAHEHWTYATGGTRDELQSNRRQNEA